jgi:hypothetical protein
MPKRKTATTTQEDLMKQLNELIDMLPMAIDDYDNEVSDGFSEEMAAEDLQEAIKHVALALATLGVIEPALDRGLIDG